MMPNLGTAATAQKPGNSGPKRNLRVRDIASYTLLPKVLPRIASLFFSGFHYFAFFVAQVYRGVRLLPDNHPSLNPQNIGNFTVRDVVGEAFRHLVWRRENLDQIIVFLAILSGLILLVLQAATFVVAIALPHAFAGGLNGVGNLAASGMGFSSIFSTPFNDGSQDIAFILLDRVFGVAGIFDSCVSVNTPCFGVSPNALNFDQTNPVYKPDTFPWAFHEGLHALFQFYSMGLLLVAVFILLYFVIVIVAETAQTGTPFGKRFNTVWAPIRLVMAFGLLIPISNGLNSAQYITLYAAKWGSNFASNGWIIFNATVNGSAKGMVQGLDLAVKPKEPEVRGLLQFMTLAHTCKVFEESTMKDVDPTPDANATAAQQQCAAENAGRKIEAYIVKPGYDATNNFKYLSETSYQDAVNFSENSDVRIRFGDRNCEGANMMAGNVAPTCGEITLPLNSITEPGAKSIQEGYYGLIQYLWGGYGGHGTTTDDIQTYANPAAIGTHQDDARERNACVPDLYNPVLNSGSGNYDHKIREYALSYFQNGPDVDSTGQCTASATNEMHTDYKPLDPPPTNWMTAAIQNYQFGSETPTTAESDIDTDVSNYGEYEGGTPPQYIVRNIIKKGVRALRTEVNNPNGRYSMSQDNLRRGWAVAGIWYNKIAEMNGALIGAAWDIPAANRYPQIMMEILNEKRQNNVQVSSKDMFSPDVAKVAIKIRGGSSGEKFARTMSGIYNKFGSIQPQESTGNVMADFVNAIFGTQGLFDLRYQQNNRSHPLAMLVGVGKGLIEASIRNLGIGMGSGLAGIVAALATGGNAGPELATAISSFFFSIATMTLTAGFILFYVIPFLPFLYFFFAVGNWLKGVFEAMVGVPLWALAHLRIDGNGLPGEAAMNGYFMLFEIFLRPILIIFGFLASISIFAAMASVLHEVFEVAVANLTGAGTGGGANSSIDKFFYTVMYTVIMYIMALSSFKLIDLIPNQLMRWMGTSVSTFSDMNSDPAGNLTQMTAIAGSQIVNQMTGGLQQGMGSLQKAAGTASQGVQAAAAKATKT